MRCVGGMELVGCSWGVERETRQSAAGRRERDWRQG